jgi:hypothetical protein
MQEQNAAANKNIFQGSSTLPHLFSWSDSVPVEFFLIELFGVFFDLP